MYTQLANTPTQIGFNLALSLSLSLSLSRWTLPLTSTLHLHSLSSFLTSTHTLTNIHPHIQLQDVALFFFENLTASQHTFTVIHRVSCQLDKANTVFFKVPVNQFFINIEKRNSLQYMISRHTVFKMIRASQVERVASCHIWIKVEWGMSIWE